MHDTYPINCPQDSRQRLHLQRHWGNVVLMVTLIMWSQLFGGIAQADERWPNADVPAEMGTLMLVDGQQQFEAVQLDAEMQVSVSGLLAQMTLTQSFRNNRNQWMQARYLFPLPESAAVQKLVIKVGNRTIHGRIMERAAARESFEAAADNGQITGLVEQQRPNLFTMDVATIAPNSEISIELTVMLPVQVDRFHRSLTLPTTHTPRYTNEHTPDATNVSGVYTTQSMQRGPRLMLSAEIEGVADHNVVSSDTHALITSDTQVVLNNVPMDRDLVIKWPAEFGNSASSQIYISEHVGEHSSGLSGELSGRLGSEESSESISERGVATGGDPASELDAKPSSNLSGDQRVSHSNERYAQILLNPPATTTAQDTARRELIIVVDKSGSMAGESMDAARKALQFALDSIKPEDTFNIVAFDDESYPLFEQSRPADSNNLKVAHRFIRNLEADGGTEMRSSLDFALKGHADPDNTRLRQVVFLTDGSVGYEDQLLLEIKRQIGDSRLFTIGIGSAPNQWFLEKAAQIGRGVFLTIPDSQSAADAIQQLLTKLINPVITDIAVQFLGGRGEIYPDPVPDLYADKPQVMVARIDQQVTNILLSGNQVLNGETVRWQQRLDVVESQVVQASDSVPSAKLFWTRLKVASLLDEQRYAVDQDVHKQQILQLALDAQLVTPYTSFVAVEQTPVREADEPLLDAEVANLIPKGNTMMDLAMPVGAAGIDTLGLLSALFAALGIALTSLSQFRMKRGCAA